MAGARGGASEAGGTTGTGDQAGERSGMAGSLFGELVHGHSSIESGAGCLKSWQIPRIIHVGCLRRQRTTAIPRMGGVRGTIRNRSLFHCEHNLF